MPLPKSILVVDDDPEVLSLLQRGLPPSEWSIELETGGDRALLCAAARKYDVVPPALETPGVSGVEFVRRLRRIRPDARVIVIAAAATPADVIESIKVHAFAHFSVRRADACPDDPPGR